MVSLFFHPCYQLNDLSHRTLLIFMVRNEPLSFGFWCNVEVVELVISIQSSHCKNKYHQRYTNTTTNHQCLNETYSNLEGLKKYSIT
jgi:hypothetical protein